MMHDIRNPADVMARLFIAVGIGALMGLVFLRNTAGEVLHLQHCWQTAAAWQ